MYLKKLAQSLGLWNVKQVDNSTSSDEKIINTLFDKEQIEGSPFWAIGNRESGYYLTMRNIRLSTKLESIKEVKQYLDENSYNCIITAILCILDIKAAEEIDRKKIVNDMYKDKNPKWVDKIINDTEEYTNKKN